MWETLVRPLTPERRLAVLAQLVSSVGDGLPPSKSPNEGGARVLGKTHSNLCRYRRSTSLVLEARSIFRSWKFICFMGSSVLLMAAVVVHARTAKTGRHDYSLLAQKSEAQKDTRASPQSAVRTLSGSSQPSKDADTIAEIDADLRSGRFQQAHAKAQKILSADPRNALALTYLGMASLHLNLLDQALEAFENAIQIDQRDSRTYLNLALLYAAKNDLDRAITSYRKGISLDPGNVTAHYNLGRLFVTAGRFEEAVAVLERAVQLKSEDTEARLALVEALLGAKRPRQVEVQVRVLLDVPGFPVPAMVSLASKLARGKEAALAKLVLDRALATSPKLDSAHLELSKLHSSLGQYEQAASTARQAVELRPDSLEAHLALAEALIGGMRNLEALEYLSTVQAQFENAAPFHYVLGLAQFGLHRHQPAIQALEIATQLDPRLDIAHFFLGTAYYATGNIDRAQTSYETAISLNPKNPIYYNYLARVYERKGPEFEAVLREVTHKAISLDPKDAESNLRLARWAIAKEDVGRARVILEQVVSVHPELIDARVLLAQVYSRLKLRSLAEGQQKIIRELEAEARTREPGGQPVGPEGKNE